MIIKNNNKNNNKIKNIFIKINLQLFAGDQSDKTEKATAKKRQDARKKGQVFQSRELSSSIALLAIFVGIKIFGGYIYKEILYLVQKVFTEYIKEEVFTFAGISKVYFECVTSLSKILLPIFAIALITGLALSYAQVGVLFTTETLAVKLEKINPLSGFKRMFSLKAIVELSKALFKISIVSFVAYSYIKNQITVILSLMSYDVLSAGIYIADIFLNVAIRMCVALIMIAILDFVYQWFEYEKSLKMSKHDIKEEHKQVEGNPEIKSKIKQKQRQMSMRRMMNEVPMADVVITNPTHFAVAIKYDKGISDAPIVIAKGQDYIALRIKEIAKENTVMIIENKILARTLFDTVEVGEKIPPELYQAVAEILAFVYNLKKTS